MRFVTEGNEENEAGIGLSSASAQDRRSHQMVRGFRRLTTLVQQLKKPSLPSFASVQLNGYG
jgi:hypothetical protein